MKLRIPLITTVHALLLPSIISLLTTTTNSQRTFPLYSQQCRDDAGPPFLDDEETFGPGNYYHTGHPAFPILPPTNTCPTPLQQACATRDSLKTAFLEGPINCQNRGWYCRILVDENWPPVALTSDVNFGYCNITEGYEDPGWDRSGHCHGSSDDSVYYWWVRDHFHRGYNGRLRCCCDWGTGPDSLTKARRITNRCDYRRLVTRDENLENCRDANEDHGLSFEGGCSADYWEEQKNKPIPENDDMCWEVGCFGYSETNPNLCLGRQPTPPTAPIAPIAFPTNSPSMVPTREGGGGGGEEPTEDEPPTSDEEPTEDEPPASDEEPTEDEPPTLDEDEELACDDMESKKDCNRHESGCCRWNKKNNFCKEKRNCGGDEDEEEDLDCGDLTEKKKCNRHSSKCCKWNRNADECRLRPQCRKKFKI